MRRVLALSMIGVLGSATAAPGQDARAPFARTRLEPGTTVTVGQPLRIIVEVLVPSYFTGGPRFAPIDVPDALTVFEDRGSNFTERIGGTTFAGQSRAYVVYPQRAGAFRVDEISVSVPYFDDDAGAAQATVAPQAVEFDAMLPAEAEGLSYFIATTRMTLRAAYDPVPDTLRVGDAFTRTITATVDGALAMVVPPIGANPIPGIAVYPDPPYVDDQGGERGAQIVGTRREAVTYVAVEEGEYEIGGVSLQWWDVGASRMRTASIDPITVVVLPSLTEAAFDLVVDSSGIVPLEDEAAPTWDLLGYVRRYGPIVALLAVVGWFGARLWRRHGPAWLARRRARLAVEAESEKAYFDKLREVVRHGDARLTVNALHAWYDRARPAGGPVAVADWIASVGDDAFSRAYEGLTATLYGPGGIGSWDGGSLVAGVERGRRRAKGEPHGGSRAALPPLDPLS